MNRQKWTNRMAACKSRHNHSVLLLLYEDQSTPKECGEDLHDFFKKQNPRHY
jgi:hypothetical protein